jgi:hypothetical protein
MNHHCKNLRLFVFNSTSGAQAEAVSSRSTKRSKAFEIKKWSSKSQKDL